MAKAIAEIRSGARCVIGERCVHGLEKSATYGVYPLKGNIGARKDKIRGVWGKHEFGKRWNAPPKGALERKIKTAVASWQWVCPCPIQIVFGDVCIGRQRCIDERGLDVSANCQAC